MKPINTDPIFEAMRGRLNAMETPDEQMAFLSDVLRVSTGLWRLFAKGQTPENGRRIMHALGAVMHATLIENVRAAGIDDDIKVRLEYLGGHCHASVFVNGALAGKLIVRMDETDMLGRALLGVQIEGASFDDGVSQTDKGASDGNRP